MTKNSTSLLYVFISIIFSIVVLTVSAQSSFSQEAESTDTIPELFIYDDDAESAALSPEKIHGFSIRHGFTKINLDAFESDKILLNAFGESVVMYLDSSNRYSWVGTSTENSGSPNAYFSWAWEHAETTSITENSGSPNAGVIIKDGLILGLVDDNDLGYLMITPLGHDGDLHIIQEVDFSLIPELFIYDEETESATFSFDSDDFGVIRHSIGKMNSTVFDSGTFLFNAFGESVLISKHPKVQGTDWIGITGNSPIPNVLFNMSDDVVIGGYVNYNRYLSVYLLGYNDLYVIQEIDLSLPQPDHHYNWGAYLYIDQLFKLYDYGSRLSRSDYVSMDVYLSNNNGVIVGRENYYHLIFFIITPLGHDDLYTRQEISSLHHKVKFSNDELTKLGQLFNDFDYVSMDTYLKKQWCGYGYCRW